VDLIGGRIAHLKPPSGAICSRDSRPFPRYPERCQPSPGERNHEAPTRTMLSKRQHGSPRRARARSVRSLWAIVIVLLLTAGGSRAIRTRHTSAEVQPPTRTIWRLLRILRTTVEWTLGTSAALLLLCAGVSEAWGPIVPTPPDIAPQDGSDQSSAPLAFSLTSKNNFFPISGLNLTCHLDLLYFKDANNKTAIIRDGMFTGEGASVPGNFNCGSDFVRIKPDGSVEIGFPGSVRMDTHPGAFAGPPTVLKMCVVISGSYVTWGFQRQVPPVAYQWPKAPGVPGWIKEPITFDIDLTKWVLPGGNLSMAISVSRQLTERLPDGSVRMLPDVLRCGPPAPLVGNHPPVTPLARIRRQSDGKEGDLYPDGRVYPPGQKPP
jgi:hypothetical protein